MANDVNASARLTGPLPNYVLVPFEGRDYEFKLGDGPLPVPLRLAEFLKSITNPQGGPAFEVEVALALLVQVPTELGTQLVANL